MLKFLEFLKESGKSGPSRWSKMIRNKYGRSTDSEIDHIRHDLFHTATDRDGENLSELSKQSQAESISSIGAGFDKHKHLRPLSGHEKRYLQHIHFNVFRPAVDDMAYAKLNNDHKAYHIAKQRVIASEVEAREHFGHIWKDAMHASTFSTKTPEQQQLVDAMHDLGLSNMPRHTRELKNSMR